SMNGPGSTPLGWYRDPSGRHELRFWDGSMWTAQVSNGGVVGIDEPNRPAGPPVSAPSSGYGLAPSGYSQGPSTYRPVAQPSPAGPPPWATAQATIPPPPPGATWSPSSVPQPYAPTGAPPLSSLGQRFGAYLLDGVLALVTLGIGWLIWCCFTFSKGQTPAKSIMDMRVVKQDTGVAATWGDMFVRNVVIPIGLGFVGIFLFGIPTIVCACLIFGGNLRQTGWDRMMRTVVVNDPQGVTVPPGR
ncbi:MAG: RDD family protein, partial [Actinobacteria bacterium]|nr:RDD family protein [Actinomycetota bacterium]